jgi:hypothetical protein
MDSGRVVGSRVGSVREAPEPRSYRWRGLAAWPRPLALAEADAPVLDECAWKNCTRPVTRNGAIYCAGHKAR